MRGTALLLLVLVTSGWNSVAGQDDRPWWKQLFRPGQETAVPAEEEVQDPLADPKGVEPGVSPSDEGIPAALDTALGEVEVREAFPFRQGKRGTVHWTIPESILALDSAQVDSASIRIPGFRVQLFMGRLDSARSLRQALMEDETLTEPVYVTPYPPLFAVTLGNFTSALAAHRVKEVIRPRFPHGLVVPLELPLDALFPVVHSEPQAPVLRGPDRD